MIILDIWWYNMSNDEIATGENLAIVNVRYSHFDDLPEHLALVADAIRGRIKGPLRGVAGEGDNVEELRGTMDRIVRETLTFVLDFPEETGMFEQYIRRTADIPLPTAEQQQEFLEALGNNFNYENLGRDSNRMFGYMFFLSRAVGCPRRQVHDAKGSYLAADSSGGVIKRAKYIDRFGFIDLTQISVYGRGKLLRAQPEIYVGPEPHNDRDYRNDRNWMTLPGELTNLGRAVSKNTIDDQNRLDVWREQLTVMVSMVHQARERYLG